MLLWINNTARALAGSRDGHDPRMLLTVKASSKKAKKIANYLPEKVKERIQRRRRDRLVFSQSEDGSIMFKPAEEDMHAITMAEWGAANMRLLGDLLHTGELAYEDVDYYLSYTMQLYELAERFEWSSLMEFDSRYRELQAEHEFRWGDMRFASQIHLLTPRRPSTQQQNRRTTTTNRERPECRQWLLSGGKSCNFGSACRYVHRKLPTSTSDHSKNDA